MKKSRCAAVLTAFTLVAARHSWARRFRAGGQTGQRSVHRGRDTNTFVVPSNVHCMFVDAIGAAGGQGATAVATSGLGGEVVDFLSVLPGQSLQVNVGGAGGDPPASAGPVGSTAARGWRRVFADVSGGGRGGASRPPGGTGPIRCSSPRWRRLRRLATAGPGCRGSRAPTAPAAGEPKAEPARRLREEAPVATEPADRRRCAVRTGRRHGRRRSRRRERGRRRWGRRRRIFGGGGGGRRGRLGSAAGAAAARASRRCSRSTRTPASTREQRRRRVELS